MLTENEKHKAKALAERERERLEDIRAQEEYARILDKQEHDRLNEVKQREVRAQEFMNRMADTVIKNMDNRARDEEEKIRRYEAEKELRERLADEAKMNRMKSEQHRMRDYLAKQMDDKRRREI
jgi:6-pyruvoyl-tetrahydropterin synthase